jgi:hypothetical protein
MQGDTEILPQPYQGHQPDKQRKNPSALDDNVNQKGCRTQTCDPSFQMHGVIR